MSGSGAGVRVLVIAVREVSSPVGQEPEPARAELIVVALEVVSAKLIYHNDHHQLGPGVIGGGKSMSGEQQETSDYYGARLGISHRAVVYRCKVLSANV